MIYRSRVARLIAWAVPLAVKPHAAQSEALDDRREGLPKSGVQGALENVSVHPVRG